tara:strand:+ start:2212 stop:2607 length:396 start_codon:yes stop_codon:yes gene_type:complete
MGTSNSIHYDKYGIEELDDSTLSPLNKNESRLVFNSQSIYNIKIRHNKILKYTIWMTRENLNKVLAYYNQKSKDSLYYSVFINNQEILIMYCETDNNWGMMLKSNYIDNDDDTDTDNHLLKLIYINQDMYC